MEYGCITTDCWLSNSTMSYLSLTVHYVDKNFFFHSDTLNLHYLEHEHTAQFIHSSLLKLMTSWNIQNKVYFIVKRIFILNKVI